MLKAVLRRALNWFGFDLRRVEVPRTLDANVVPDAELYQPLFSPWLGRGDFGRYYERAASNTLVSRDRAYVLYTLLRQTARLAGDVWECGVYRGGTAAMMAAIVGEWCPDKRLYLFDTFAGMPETDSARDWHRQGDFSDTSVEAVAAFVGHGDRCIFRKGELPSTFAGLEQAQIAFAHVDVDIYRSVADCLEFIWPRVSVGGCVVIDDYGFPTCPGARAAVDEFFRGTPYLPWCLPTGQAVVLKNVG